MTGMTIEWAPFTLVEGVTEAELPAAMEGQVCHRYFSLMVGADHADAGEGVSHFVVRENYGAAVAPP